MQNEKAPVFWKRIGATTYEVAVHFSKTSKETLRDKIIRLILRDAPQAKKAAEKRKK
jgi:hypothetical protein